MIDSSVEDEWAPVDSIDKGPCIFDMKDRTVNVTPDRDETCRYPSRGYYGDSTVGSFGDEGKGRRLGKWWGNFVQETRS